MRILCLNAGSVEVRLAAYEGDRWDLTEVLPKRTVSDTAWRAHMGTFAPDVIAHRIVRGKKTDVACEPYSEDVRTGVLRMQNVAPTYDAHALELIATAQIVFPRAHQLVVYDSAFHATIPAENSTYAIPEQWRKLGIRRVGFHGLSCAYAVEWLAEHAGKPRRIVHAHLADTCSVTAMVDGKSVATTMGYTPLDGVVMGTRSGSIDPMIVVDMLLRDVNLSTVQAALLRESGLRALCGTDDMRTIEARRSHGDADAILAFDVFVGSVAGAIAQVSVAAGGIDALSLAGGIGLRSTAVREALRAKLDFLLGDLPIYPINVQEELMMARAVIASQVPA
jgi:acetate kinase